MAAPVRTLGEPELLRCDIKTLDYSYPLAPEDKIRICFTKNRGKVEYFIVQYSALIKGKWRSIMRFDTCHGYAHKHTFHLPKKLIQKNIKLSGEFDKYISENPKAFSRVPSGVHVVITSSSDNTLSESNISIARNSRSGNFIEAHKSGGSWHIKPFEK